MFFFQALHDLVDLACGNSAGLSSHGEASCVLQLADSFKKFCLKVVGEGATAEKVLSLFVIPTCGDHFFQIAEELKSAEVADAKATKLSKIIHSRMSELKEVAASRVVSLSHAHLADFDWKLQVLPSVFIFRGGRFPPEFVEACFLEKRKTFVSRPAKGDHG